MHKLKSKKGVALLMVISSLLLLTSIVVDFAYNSNVTFNVAMNERDRLQANYLAQTAYQFALILIRFDRDTKDMVRQASQKLGRTVQIKPLYKMLPINSEMLRGLAQMATGAEKGGTGEWELSADQLSNIKQSADMMSEKQAKSFLSFEGNFNAEVDAEDGKIPLNAFYYLTPTQPEYDRLKTVLISLLRQNELLKYIKDKQRGPEELTNRIADYIDKNDVINEMGGSERGSESSVYVGTKAKPKNAKLLSVDELIFIPGMNEDLLEELKKHVTVYGSADKINACAAGDGLLKGLIIAYSQRSDIEPIRADNDERLTNVLKKVREKCPDPQAMAQALNESLGISGGGGAGAAASPASTAVPASQPAPTSMPGGAGAGAANQNSFASMISSNENYLRIQATGTMDHAEVKIVAVVDTSNANPDQWKILYWRVQ
ncbi:MAG: general secretion pathway protein GspK [Deltaproteobacteria bacterium]|nr:general secretion pathway protein GspK [Deltaproteobacteria bacterium]